MSLNRVHPIKRDYVLNVIKSASLCRYITKIILFGSSLEERCSEYSDIDIAVFGTKTKSYIMNLKDYQKFTRAVCGYKIENLQDYDILYFEEGKEKEIQSELMKNILKGEVIYEKDKVYMV